MRRPSHFCIECGASMAPNAPFCGRCGAKLPEELTALPLPGPVPAKPSAGSPVPLTAAEARVVRHLSDYERYLGYLWVALGVLQVMSILFAIAGVTNLYRGRSRTLIAEKILDQDPEIPIAFLGIGRLIFDTLINLLFGGWIGVLLVIFDAHLRSQVLANQELFESIEAPNAPSTL